MEEKLNGIVLGGINYGDFDKILSIFTLEKGTVSAKIKGVKKAGAKLKFASEPFCFAEFVFLKSTDKRTVKTVSLHDSYYSLREDIVKYYSASVVVEFIRKFQREEMVAESLFMLTAQTLKELAYSDLPPKFIVARFLYDALKNTGFGITFGNCEGCGCPITTRPFFNADTGSFSCGDCAEIGSREIKGQTYDEIRDLDEKRLGDTTYDGALRLMDYYISAKTDENLSSLKELIKL